MKKIVLLSTAVIFSLAVMAQAESKVVKAKTDAQAAHKDAALKSTKVQPATAEVKPQVVQAPAAGSQPSPDDVMKINTVKHDFGKIPQSTPVTYAFELKNTSTKPLVVENTYASCGCTTPEKIVEPIAPGATAKLKVQYNAANPGSFTKDVHIKLAGITQEKIVQITGEVVPAEPVKPADPVKPNN